MRVSHTVELSRLVDQLGTSFDDFIHINTRVLATNITLWGKGLAKFIGRWGHQHTMLLSGAQGSCLGTNRLDGMDRNAINLARRSAVCIGNICLARLSVAVTKRIAKCQTQLGSQGPVGAVCYHISRHSCGSCAWLQWIIF